ncbi:MAG: hypothetical protein Kow0077_26110 [Anaerolineae bacterium]
MSKPYDRACELFAESLEQGFPPDRCHLCGAGVHEGLKGCYEAYTDLLGREYTRPAFAAVHLYTVDAYSLQHGELSSRGNNAVHLLRLCWLVEQDGNPHIAGGGSRWLQAWAERTEVPYLPPPARRGALTVMALAGIDDPAVYARQARAWAEAVWAAWEAHHEWARATLKSALR